MNSFCYNLQIELQLWMFFFLHSQWFSVNCNSSNRDIGATVPLRYLMNHNLCCSICMCNRLSNGRTSLIKIFCALEMSKTLLLKPNVKSTRLCSNVIIYESLRFLYAMLNLSLKLRNIDIALFSAQWLPFVYQWSR